MVRSSISCFGMLLRTVLAVALIAGLVLVAFVAYKGSQPMSTQGANGMTYWQFMGDRLQAIHTLPAKCQEMHFTDYILTVPFYPVLYTFEGLYPDSLLARMSMPYPAIPKDVHWNQAPGAWWSLVEYISWDAWVTSHLPSIMPECNLKPPASMTATIK